MAKVIGVSIGSQPEFTVTAAKKVQPSDGSLVLVGLGDETVHRSNGAPDGGRSRALGQLGLNGRVEMVQPMLPSG